MDEQHTDELNDFMELVRKVGDKALRRTADEAKPKRTPEQEAAFQEMLKIVEEEMREGMRNQ